MHATFSPAMGRPRIGSLFSGYGGLDLAVEHATGGQTVWFSELNTAVAGVFARHWPDAPNLGDISTIDWATVPPVDILCGGFPCLNVKRGWGVARVDAETGPVTGEWLCASGGRIGSLCRRRGPSALRTRGRSTRTSRRC